MRVSTANLMCNMILDRSFDYDNKEIHHLIHLIEQFLKVFSQTKVILVDYVPITRPFLGQAAKEVDVLRKELTACVMSKVTEHQRSFTSDSEFRGFLDFYLAKMAEEPDIFTLEDLRFVLVDLMIASIHTTSSTLAFALLYMALNPDVQKQVHDEAIKVCIKMCLSYGWWYPLTSKHGWRAAPKNWCKAAAILVQSKSRRICTTFNEGPMGHSRIWSK